MSEHTVLVKEWRIFSWFEFLLFYFCVICVLVYREISLDMNNLNLLYVFCEEAIN